MIKKTRYIPSNSIKVEYPDANAVVYINDKTVIAYSGKRNNSDFHYSFPSSEKMNKYIEEYINSLKNKIQSKLEYKAKLKAESQIPHSLIIGDIMTSSGGYDQTNVYAYQVIATTKHTVTLRRIELSSVNGSEGFMSDKVVPIKDSFVSEESETKRVNKDNYCSGGWGTIRKWDGKSLYRSWYA